MEQQSGNDHFAHNHVPPPVAVALLADRGNNRVGCLRMVDVVDRQFRPQGALASDAGLLGAFVGLIPPVFLTDEIEGIDPRDILYAGAIGIVGLVVPIITVPTATGTVTKAWSDRALDVYRLNVRENRPSVEEASARIADHFRQRGLSGTSLKQGTSRVLGSLAAIESIAHGFRSGLRFLSLRMLVLGVAVAISLAHAAHGLSAPPGSGYT